MRAGVFQSNGQGLTPDQRIDKLAEVLQQQSLDLVVCPELFLSGYNVGEALLDYAEPSDGPMAVKIAQLARSTQTAIVYGYPEILGEQLFNAANCFSAAGEWLATHRKLCLPPGFETDYFEAGNRATVFELSGLHCGMLVCYDVEFPESVRALSAAGAQLIIVPTALGEQWGNVALQLIPTRAFENGVWLLYANHAGAENGMRYFGGSCIVAPNGSDAARAGSDETLISTDVNAQAVIDAQLRLPYLREYRRIVVRLNGD